LSHSIALMSFVRTRLSFAIRLPFAFRLDPIAYH